MERKKFAVLGGDERNIYLSELLEKDGHSVTRYGFDRYEKKVIKESENMYEALSEVDYVIGPTPCCHNSDDLNAIYSGKIIKIDEIFRLIRPNQIFMAGHLISSTKEIAERYRVKCIDLLKREELALMNAIPTALSK